MIMSIPQRISFISMENESLLDHAEPRPGPRGGAPFWVRMSPQTG
jgi:hypothetical protein